MIITISDPKAHVTASIDSVGAQLISLKDKTDKEYIWQRDPDIWPAALLCCSRLWATAETTAPALKEHGMRWKSTAFARNLILP